MDKKYNKKYKHYAWCPKCFDALDIIDIKDEHDLTIGHEYECELCEKIFVLNAKGVQDEKR